MRKPYILFAVIILLLIGFVIAVPLVNNSSAKKVEQQLLSAEVPEDTRVIESVSAAGKLVGNGNGMQYLGAILIKSELSFGELSDFYGKALPDAFVKEQKGQKIDIAEHENLSFEAEINNSDSYYIVYLFGDGAWPFSKLDIRGH